MPSQDSNEFEEVRTGFFFAQLPFEGSYSSPQKLCRWSYVTYWSLEEREFGRSRTIAVRFNANALGPVSLDLVAAIIGNGDCFSANSICWVRSQRCPYVVWSQQNVERTQISGCTPPQLNISKRKHIQAAEPLNRSSEQIDCSTFWWKRYRVGVLSPVATRGPCRSRATIFGNRPRSAVFPSLRPSRRRPKLYLRRLRVWHVPAHRWWLRRRQRTILPRRDRRLRLASGRAKKRDVITATPNNENRITP